MEKKQQVFAVKHLRRAINVTDRAFLTAMRIDHTYNVYTDRTKRVPGPSSSPC